MSTIHDRTKIIVKEDGLKRLQNSNILLAGLGGVGGYAVEALVRAGIGNLTIVDNDVVDISNINRQIIATHSNIGNKKTDLFKQRIADINPDCNVNAETIFLDNSNIEQVLNAEKYSYVIDCIDSLNCKVGLVETAWKMDIKVYSSMGAGGKTDPLAVEVTDLFKTTVCPLAKFMRIRLKKRGVGKGIKAVFSKETPVAPLPPEPSEENTCRNRSTLGSISYIPAIFGLTLAGEVIRDIVNSHYY